MTQKEKIEDFYDLLKEKRLGKGAFGEVI